MCLTHLRRCTQTRADGATGVVEKHVGRRQLSPRCALAEQRVEDVMLREQAAPAWSRAGEWAVLEAASSSTRGSGWAPSGRASPWECRAAQNRQARPEEVQGPSWANAKGGTLNTLSRGSTTMARVSAGNWSRMRQYE